MRTDLAKKKRLADLEAMHQAAAEDYWSLGSVNLERGGFLLSEFALNCHDAPHLIWNCMNFRFCQFPT